MKKTALSAALLCLAQSTLHADVPPFINYQGKVADSTGLPIGASGTAAAPVAAPVNRKVIFRIYDASTNGNRLWTEEQTATISLGVFSVLLGNGIAPTGTAAGESRPALDTVFTPSAASSRFLEIMVDNGDNAINGSDKPISPRQQITSTAFALHAKVADGIAPATSTSTDLNISPATLPSGSLASNYGLGWYGTGRPFNSVAVDGPVLYGNSGGALGSAAGTSKNIALAWNARGQVGIGATSITSNTNKLTLQGDMDATPADQLTIRGTETAKRLHIGYNTFSNWGSLQSYTASGPGVLLLNPSGGNVGIGNAAAPSVALDVTGAIKASTTIAAGTTITAGGNVGIGTPASGFPLNFANALGDKIALWGSSGNHYGFGVQNSLLQIHTDAPGGDVAFGYGSSAAMTETMRIKGNGNVGIGTSAPLGKFTVNSGDSAITIGNTDVTTGAWIRNEGLNTVFSTNVGDMYFGLIGNSKNLHFYNGPSEVMNVNKNGNVGIGTTTPTQAKLVVIGTVRNHPGTTGQKTYYNRFSWYATSNSDAQEVGIYADQCIWTNNQVFVSSDKRIKNIEGVSNGQEDLSALLGIEITNYRMKDAVSNDQKLHKKVIAQQVEQFYPLAVSKQTGVVPDVFEKAKINGAWISLASDLKKGDRVKLVTQVKGGTEEKEGIHEVLEVADGKFRTDFKSDGEVFVYGREVKDFRNVDYDAIAMLNVSATQELKREKDAEIQTLRDENAALRRELAAKDASLETRLIALERSLSEASPVKTVSLQTAKAAE